MLIAPFVIRNNKLPYQLIKAQHQLLNMDYRGQDKDRDHHHLSRQISNKLLPLFVMFILRYQILDFKCGGQFQGEQKIYLIALCIELM